MKISEHLSPVSKMVCFSSLLYLPSSSLSRLSHLSSFFLLFIGNNSQGRYELNRNAFLGQLKGLAQSTKSVIDGVNAVYPVIPTEPKTLTEDDLAEEHDDVPTCTGYVFILFHCFPLSLTRLSLLPSLVASWSLKRTPAPSNSPHPSGILPASCARNAASQLKVPSF